MIAGSRDAVLDTLRKFGQERCAYAWHQSWPLNTCDCKYGGPDQRTVEFAGKQMPVMSEQTGCPELRTLYTLVAVITDAEWADLIERAGCVTSEQLRAALESHFNGESS